MRSKGSNVDLELSLFNPRLAVWVLVFVLLMMTLLFSLRRVEPEASKTAYIVAAKLILENANTYKQNWLVKNQPDHLFVDGQQLRFSKNGWLIPDSEDDTGCDHWLQLLYPEKQVFGDKLLKSKFRLIDEGYICRYNYSNNVIVIKLLSGKFSVSTEFFAL